MVSGRQAAQVDKTDKRTEHRNTPVEIAAEKASLMDRLRQSATVLDVTDGNAQFLKSLVAVYCTSKKLKEEIALASNTKKEVKALVANLANATKGLIA